MARKAAPARGSSPASRSGAKAKPAARRSASSTSRPAGRADAEAGRKALARVDGPRGRRTGRGRSAAQAKVQSRRRLGGALAATLMAVGVLYVVAFPAQSLWTQRAATTKAEAQLQDLRSQRIQAKRKADLLHTPEQIRKLAIQLYGLQDPGSEVYDVLPGPAEPTGLPTTWPFTGVERALGGN